MKTIIWIFIFLMLGNIVFSTSLLGENVTVIYQEFTVKIYAEEKYMIKIPYGCYPTRYQNQVDNFTLTGTISDHPTFICTESGEKTFYGKYYYNNTWMDAMPHTIIVLKTKEELAADNYITSDNISQLVKNWTTNEIDVIVKTKGPPWWVYMIMVFVVLIGIGVPTAIYYLMDD